MFYYYRISDNSYQKEKLPGIGKKECLENFLSIFGTRNVLIVADNCSSETIKYIDSLGVDRKISTLGNAGSLRWCLMDAINELNEEYVYFVEDDYLHHKDADKMLLDGFSLDDTSYTTFFDHPDKYTEHYGYGETSKVYYNKHHWRLTQSTTMTFIAKMDSLKKHWKIWDEYTSDNHPHDHHIFTKILEIYGGKLACAIPGLAVHTDLNVSIGLGKITIEPWAIELACQSLEQKLKDNELFKTIIATTSENSWQRIKLLHALSFLNNKF